MAPAIAASTITLDSRARTMARKRCGTSSGRLNQLMGNSPLRSSVGLDHRYTRIRLDMVGLIGSYFDRDAAYNKTLRVSV
jgi:hypothetical protein